MHIPLHAILQLTTRHALFAIATFGLVSEPYMNSGLPCHNSCYVLGKSLYLQTARACQRHRFSGIACSAACNILTSTGASLLGGNSYRSLVHNLLLNAIYVYSGLSSLPFPSASAISWTFDMQGLRLLDGMGGEDRKTASLYAASTRSVW